MTPRPLCISTLLLAVLAGCAAVPDVVPQPKLHNPFPQLRAVAVLPFSNQSNTDPTVDGDEVANFYATQLQQIPGFEVVPVGVTRQAMSNLLNGKAALSAEMAIRFEKAFGVRAETMLRMQAAYDLVEARAHEDEIKVERIAVLA